MNDRTISALADYADAMLAARRAKNLLFLVILLILLSQISIFLIGRYQIDFSEANNRDDFLRYWIGVTDFLGIIAPVVLGVDLLLILAIMLVGRLIGVANLVWAFLWCVVLAILLFPWQAFLINATFTSPEFRIPGVLYNWAELILRVREHDSGWKLVGLFWARLVGFPVVALAVLLKIQMGSRRGMRLALGEAPAPVDVSVGR
ncbi:MAG: hypothetical protein ABSG31_10750 [Tepidisphaeraceae bacterium]